MFNVKWSGFSIFLSILLSALIITCASTPQQQGNNNSAAEAQASAMAALDRMDGGGGGGGVGGGASNTRQQPAGQSTTTVTTGARPAWVDSPDSVFARATFVTAQGVASNREMAERNAFSNLVAFFGQSIQADQTITNIYQEAVRGGVVTGWSDNIEMQNTIRMTAAMDNLVGAEIRGVWHDTRNNAFHAIAVMEKQQAVRMYTDMILANQDMIRNLTNLSQAERNTLEGFSRFLFAAAVADINITYVNLLNLLDARPPAGVRRGDDFRLDAQNIARAIPIGIVVTNDRDGRIHSALAKSLSELGFRSGPANSRYVLRSNVDLSPVDLPNNPNQFVRIVVTANLTDTTTGAVILPYNFNSREGHATVREAENRAFLAAERRIDSEYRDHLSSHLAQLIPRR
jgi:hypothetical protein